MSLKFFYQIASEDGRSDGHDDGDDVPAGERLAWVRVPDVGPAAQRGPRDRHPFSQQTKQKLENKNGEKCLNKVQVNFRLMFLAVYFYFF